MPKKVTVQFEMDLETAKALAASNKSSTRRLNVADIEKLAEHGQLKASALMAERDAADAMVMIAKLSSSRQIAPADSKLRFKAISRHLDNEKVIVKIGDRKMQVATDPSDLVTRPSTRRR